MDYIPNLQDTLKIIRLWKSQQQENSKLHIGVQTLNDTQKIKMRSGVFNWYSLYDSMPRITVDFNKQLLLLIPISEV